MPERAEIEAVMRALVESEHAPHYGSEHCVCGPQATPADDCPVHWAIAVVERLQDAARARDARGDDETGRRTVETVLGPLKVVPECRAQAVCVNGSKCWEAGRCLRHRQGEDHEAGIEAMGEVWVKLGNRDGLFGCVGLLDEASRRALIERYLSRVSPSRDGTVAVEDVRAQTIVGITTALRNATITPEGGLDVTDTWDLAADFIEREFGSARAGESDEGGNQNDERRH